jgi:hypothetical protein
MKNGQKEREIQRMMGRKKMGQRERNRGRNKNKYLLEEVKNEN